MRTIKKIVIHCSDSGFGNVPLIRLWHTAPPPQGRGWKDIGYHYIIQNGVDTARDEYQEHLDGKLCIGRPVEQVGAHCKGHNADSIGICLVGKTEFTERQFEELYKFLLALLKEYKLQPGNVYGHREFDPGKTCPNFDMATVRAELTKRLTA